MTWKPMELLHFLAPDCPDRPGSSSVSSGMFEAQPASDPWIFHPRAGIYRCDGLCSALLSNLGSVILEFDYIYSMFSSVLYFRQ